MCVHVNNETREVDSLPLGSRCTRKMGIRTSYDHSDRARQRRPDVELTQTEKRVLWFLSNRRCDQVARDTNGRRGGERWPLCEVRSQCTIVSVVVDTDDVEQVVCGGFCQCQMGDLVTRLRMIERHRGCRAVKQKTPIIRRRGCPAVGCSELAEKGLS